MTAGARPAGATVHLDVRDGLRFDPSDVGPLDVPASEVARFIATGAYVVSGEEAHPTETAVTADQPEEADPDAK